MATGKKTGGRDFPPGVSGNPAGRPPDPPEVKAAKKALKKLTRPDYELAISRLLTMSVSDLKKLTSKDGIETTPVMEVMIARILEKGISTGSTHELNYFVEWLMGKLAENHNFSGNLNAGIVTFLDSLNKPPQNLIQDVQEIEDEEI